MKNAYNFNIKPFIFNVEVGVQKILSESSLTLRSRFSKSPSQTKPTSLIATERLRRIVGAATPPLPGASFLESTQ